VISTPFLIRLHAEPEDYWRFTPTAMTMLIEGAGLVDVEVHQWGNRSCFRANTRSWAPQMPWHRGWLLRNEPELPLMIWAFARRPAHAGDARPAGITGQ
jgi:hypothetical protein